MTQLPDAEQLALDLAHRIGLYLSEPGRAASCALVGIHTGGAWLAERLQQALGGDLPLGALDVSFYRDDFQRIGLHPETKPSRIPFEVEGCHIILIDDVLNTGRTVRAAMNYLFDYGRPASISLAVMIDRGGRELPVAARFVGAAIDLERSRNIQLERGADGRLSLSLKEAV
ncbi:MAG: bifunctional pyr operon transcriptional regulator/uracil phosphoribosyltransferase PyrR [Sulfuricellaceae bacterium]